MNLPILLFLLGSFFGPYSTTSNISVDLTGTPDTRDTTWGSAGYIQTKLAFHPPAGYRTRILRVYGDFVAWPKSGVIPPGTSVEIGWGLKTTAADGSVTDVTYPDAPGAYPYANSFVWVQGMLTAPQPGQRIPFDLDSSAGGLLGPDNILISQPFVALNTSGLQIHMEPTFTAVYRYEQETTRR